MGEPRGRAPGSPSGAGAGLAQGWVSAPPPGLGGLRVPADGQGPLGSALRLGLPAGRGRSLCRVSGRTPRRPRQVPGAGTSAAAGDGVPTGGSDRNLFSQRGGMLPMSRGPGLFRGLHRRRRLLPHTRVGGGCLEGREVPVQPGLEAPAPEAGG